MNMEIGLILRLAGPLIQVVCMFLLMGTSLGRREIAGLPIATLLYGGFFLGFALVLVGLFLSRRPRGER